MNDIGDMGSARIDMGEEERLRRFRDARSKGQLEYIELESSSGIVRCCVRDAVTGEIFKYRVKATAEKENELRSKVRSMNARMGKEMRKRGVYVVKETSGIITSVHLFDDAGEGRL